MVREHKQFRIINIEKQYYVHKQGPVVDDGIPFHKLAMQSPPALDAQGYPSKVRWLVIEGGLDPLPDRLQARA